MPATSRQLKHGQVCQYATPQNRNPVTPVVGFHYDGHIIRIVHHMTIGDHQPVGTDDKARRPVPDIYRWSNRLQHAPATVLPSAAEE